MEKLKEINGALSLISVSDDFAKDYCSINVANLFLNPMKMVGVVLNSKEHGEKGFLAAKVSMPSFMGLKNILDKDENSEIQKAFMVDDNNNIYKVANTVFGFFGNEPILGFCDQYLKDSKFLTGNIVFRNGDDLLCSEIGLGDMLYMFLAFDLPIYIRKEVMNNNGTEFENAIEIDAY